MHKYLPKAFLLLAIFVSCSSTEDNTLTHTKHKQHKAEYIYRKHDEILMIPSSATKRPSPQYPWKKNQINGQSKISKEYFRCRKYSTNNRLEYSQPLRTVNHLATSIIAQSQSFSTANHLTQPII